jgi:hypothetical protein
MLLGHEWLIYEWQNLSNRDSLLGVTHDECDVIITSMGA